MIHIIIGTRAQLIKMAPIMVELQNQKIDYNFIFLAQHKETIDSMIDMFNIKKPDIIIGKLDTDITSSTKMAFWSLKVLFQSLKDKKKIFRGDKKGIVLVHGDAPPAFLGALMSKFSGLKVGHVESGLRSFNLFNPFPEEIIRILTFKLTDYYFCPGDWALDNLKKHNGIKVNTEQNTLLDSLILAKKNQKKIKVDIPKEKYAVVTTHRFETITNKKKFEDMIGMIIEISKKIKLLFILHPPTRKKLEEYNLTQKLQQEKNIELRPRYDYFEFIKLIDNSEFVMTDGGSNQEECFYLGKPCLILRNETERKEGLGKDENAVISKFDSKIINDFVDNYKRCKISPNKKEKKSISPSKMIIDEIRGFK